ncbi:MAG: N-acetyltransferase family protein [Halobacteriota archaeon]
MTESTRRAEHSNLMVRRARPRDLQDVLQLYAQLFADTDQAVEDTHVIAPAHRSAFSEIDRDHNTSLLVAESSGRVLGTLSITIVPNLSHGGRCWAIIENVVVDERVRRANVGASLMHHAIALAREKDCFRIILSSSVHRKDSHRFYENLGFEAYGHSFERYLSDT